MIISHFDRLGVTGDHMTSNRHPLDQCNPVQPERRRPLYIRDKIYAGLVGLVVGDAYGMPVEMMPREHVQKLFGHIEGLVEITQPTVIDGYVYLPRGQKGRVTDDTYFNFYIIEKMMERGSLDESAIAEVFFEKALEMFDTPFYGPTTKAGAKRMLRGVDPRTTGLPSSPRGEAQSCGSATLRSTPIGMAHPGRPEEAALEAVRASLPTHGSRVALEAAGCFAAAVAAAMVSQPTMEQIYEAALLGCRIASQHGRPVIAPSIAKRIEVAWKIAKQIDNPYQAALECYQVIGAGLPAAESIPTGLGVFFASGPDLMKAVLASVNVGGDADSVASLAGALSGVFGGIANCPKEVISEIEHVNNINVKTMAGKFADWVVSRQESEKK
jgi:ADP-ribosylglycohydrolase